MTHVTSIGLDVHARSVTAVAFNPQTGEVSSKRFAYAPAEIAEWMASFDFPKAVYESGVTGFHLVRELRALGADCIVGAVSKMQKPASDKRRKNDRRDAEFLARQLAARNIVEVWVPDPECEAARDVVRALEDARVDLARAKHRLTHLLIRHGHVFDETGPGGRRKGTWTRAHWAWMESIRLSEPAACDVLASYILEVRHLERRKELLEEKVGELAGEKRWRKRVSSLQLFVGIGEVTALSLVVETGAFSRFESARAYSSWLGLAPSEKSSGDKTSTGGITKAGNALLRRLLIEAAWHYAHASGAPKKSAPKDGVLPAVAAHAAKGTRRLAERRALFAARRMRPGVANVACARELSCWVWAVGLMAEQAGA